MALNSKTVIEVRNGGSDTNGGGFTTGDSGTDWSLQTAAQYAVTDAVANGSTTVTSATANFGTDVVGNLIYLAGGTGALSAARYRILTRSNATTITVDRTVATGTGITANIGGALASVGEAAATATVAGIQVAIKYHATAFTLTSASTGVSGGTVTGSVDGVLYYGYDNTRSPFNADANRPTIKVGAGLTVSGGIFAGSGSYTVNNLILDGDNQTSCRGIGSSFTGTAVNVKFINFNNTGMAAGTAFYCEATACSTAAAFSAVNARWCSAHDNTFTGFNTGTVRDCLSYGNSGASSDGFLNPTSAVNCSAYNNGRDGFRFTGANTYPVVNCAAENNAGFGYLTSSTSSRLILIKCGDYNNTSGRSSATSAIPANDINAIAGVATLFANAAGANFGQATALKGTGYPSSLPPGTTSTYEDIGAGQHTPTAGGGARVIGG
jgi:hypothetical protein